MNADQAHREEGQSELTSGESTWQEKWGSRSTAKPTKAPKLPGDRAVEYRKERRKRIERCMQDDGEGAQRLEEAAKRNERDNQHEDPPMKPAAEN